MCVCERAVALVINSVLVCVCSLCVLLAELVFTRGGCVVVLVLVFVNVSVRVSVFVLLSVLVVMYVCFVVFVRL